MPLPALSFHSPQSWRALASLTALVLATLAPAAALAQGPDGPTPTPAPAPVPGSEPELRPIAPAAPTARAQGLAVVGTSSSDIAFNLARALYRTRLRPTTLTEAGARALAGGPVDAHATAATRELATLRETIASADSSAAQPDALRRITERLHLVGLVVVSGESQPVARLWLADENDYDAATYATDPDPTHGWSRTVASLERRFAVTPTPAPEETLLPAVPAATQPEPAPVQPGQPFFKSPWFWGAITGALLVGGAFFFASRDTGSGAIHLQMQVPQ